jgi:hypothetical protein
MNLDVPPLQLTDNVRHMGPDDVQSSVVFANISRVLASHDQQIVDAFNSLVSDLKNVLIPVPIMLPRTSIPSLGTVWVGNLRIPTGFNATILNASVSSAPVEKQCQLQIIHSAGTYGQNGSGSGVTTLVNTTDEYTASGSYVGEGELIFKVVSTATARIAFSASIYVVLKQVVTAGSTGTPTIPVPPV